MRYFHFVTDERWKFTSVQLRQDQRGAECKHSRTTLMLLTQLSPKL